MALFFYYPTFEYLLLSLEIYGQPNCLWYQILNITLSSQVSPVAFLIPYLLVEIGAETIGFVLWPYHSIFGG